MALTANYTYVKGDDQWSDNPFQLARNLNFASNVVDLGGRFEFNFMKINTAAVIIGLRPMFLGVLLFLDLPPRRNIRASGTTLETWVRKVSLPERNITFCNRH